MTRTTARAVDERHGTLTSLLEARGETELHELATTLGASEATVRRDLSRLEAQGRIVRTHGGARLREAPSLLTRTFEQRRKTLREEKEKIAQAAAQLVQPGMTIALDSGTTVWRVAVALKGKTPLTIVTSALAPVEELGAIPDISIHQTGGCFRLENLDFVGAAAVAALSGFRADIAFIGADSVVPGRGIYSINEWGAVIAAAIAACAKQVVVVADHTKFNAPGTYLILPLNRVNRLIMDAGLPAKRRIELTKELPGLQLVE
jgi:DeoR/GlpR family transcriptional regulator of sugar metabolism